MPRHTIDQDDPLLTAYALGEMPQEEKEEFELRLEESPLARKELAALKGVALNLNSALEEEWQSKFVEANETEGDSLLLTAYAAGEMNSAEREAFELELGDSTGAREELAEMGDFMSLLGESLEKEWKENAPVTASEDLVSKGVADKVVAFRGEKSRFKGRGIAVAAACAAMLAVGSMFLDKPVSQENAGGWATVSESDSGIANSVDSTDVNNEEAEILVPTMILAEGNGGIEGNMPSVNAGYLEEGRIIKASFQPASSSQPTSSTQGGIDPLWFKAQLERVDSYLPPVTEGNVSFEMKTGSYEGQPAKTYLVADRRNHENGTSSVYVRGLVTLEDHLENVDLSAIGSQVLAGFEPSLVSSSSAGFHASSATATTTQGSNLAAGVVELQSSLVDMLVDLEKVEGDASASQVESLKNQLRKAIARSKSLAATAGKN